MLATIVLLNISVIAIVSVDGATTAAIANTGYYIYSVLHYCCLYMDSIHYDRNELLQSVVVELYNPPRNPPLTLITTEDRPQFNPLALHSSPFNCVRPYTH